MVSVVILDNGEPNVIRLTYENLYRELKDIDKSELLVSSDWFSAVPQIKNPYVCFVESDCLVNSGYFSSMLGLLKKNPMFRKIAVMGAATAVNPEFDTNNNWANKFYGYKLGDNYSDGIIPIKDKKSRGVYAVQVGYIPGSIVRMSMLRVALRDIRPTNTWKNNLVYLSTQLSLAFWRQGDGNRVHINPNSTYVTTEDYVNNIAHFGFLSELGDLAEKFGRESI